MAIGYRQEIASASFSAALRRKPSPALAADTAGAVSQTQKQTAPPEDRRGCTIVKQLGRLWRHVAVPLSRRVGTRRC